MDEKKSEILKYLYGSIQYVVDLPVVLKIMKVVMKKKYYLLFSAHN